MQKSARELAGARCQAIAFGMLVTLTDLLPPRVRYGYIHPFTRRLLQRPLPRISATVADAPGPARPVVESPGHTIHCTIVGGSLDVGGIGSMVDLLARRLPDVEVRTSVLCSSDGDRAARLRRSGVPVFIAQTEGEAREALRTLAPAVIQLHGAPEHLERAALAAKIPLVPVLHNTEIHYSRRRWERLTRLLAASPTAVAVSDGVREFHVRRVPEVLAHRITTVANAVPGRRLPAPDERMRARAELGHVTGLDLKERVVFVSLLRYDAQKNVAGLVASFLASVQDPRVHLVIAGEPSDWAEMRRADALRRCSASAERVSLLAASDAGVLLAAADGFILDSFFEGWPVAATEAAAMGLPLVMADVGGARELVDRDPDRSVLVSNPCGPADEVSDAAVARARRRARRQDNAAELGAAIASVSRSLAARRPPPNPDGNSRMGEMLERHARILVHAAQEEPHRQYPRAREQER